MFVIFWEASEHARNAPSVQPLLVEHTDAAPRVVLEINAPLIHCGVSVEPELIGTELIRSKRSKATAKIITGRSGLPVASVAPLANSSIEYGTARVRGHRTACAGRRRSRARRARHVRICSLARGPSRAHARATTH